MKSQNVRYVPEIDHLRLLAAGLVLAFHFLHIYAGGWRPWQGTPLLGFLAEGHTGVSLFFVLSGFVFMHIANGAREIQYGRFLRNRLLRIAPLFLTVFVVAVSIGRDRFVAGDLIYLFVTNIGQPPTSWFFLTGTAWSISVEFAFYMVFPFLAVFVAREGPGYLLKLLVVLAAVKAATWFVSDSSKLVYYSTLVGRFDQFLIGMLAALVHDRRSAPGAAAARAMLAMAAAAMVVALTLQGRYASYFAPEKNDPVWIWWGTVEAAGWAFFLLAYLWARLPWPAPLEQAWRKGGEWSFSIYMWHPLVIVLAWNLLPRTGMAWIGVAALATAVATAFFSWLSYTTIEKPFLDLRSRYVG